MVSFRPHLDFHLDGGRVQSHPRLRLDGGRAASVHLQLTLYSFVFFNVFSIRCIQFNHLEVCHL